MNSMSQSLTKSFRLAPLLLLLFGYRAGGADSFIAITNSGSAVAAWSEYGNYNLEGSSWYRDGGIVLGDNINYSRPLYAFYLPPAQMASGVREITQLTVRIYGHGSALGSAHVNIGGQSVSDLSKSEQWNVYTFSGATARALLTSPLSGEPSRLDVVLNLDSADDYYDLRKIIVEYTYSGVPEDWLRCYHFLLGVQRGLFNFRSEAQWGYDTVTRLAISHMKVVAMKAISGLLSGVVSGMAMDLEPIVDLVNAPSDIEGMWNDWGFPIQDAYNWYYFWTLGPGARIDDFRPKLDTTLESLRLLNAAWQGAMQDGVLSVAEQADIDTKVDIAKAQVAGLQTTLQNIGTQINFWALAGSADDATKGRELLCSLYPHVTYDLNDGAVLSSQIFWQASHLDAARPPVATLTVSSLNPAAGVNIASAPFDTKGLGGGTTSFTRAFNRNAIVTLTAPALVGTHPFTKWERNGIDWSTSQQTQVTMDYPYTLTAVYGYVQDSGAPVVSFVSPTAGASWTTSANRVYLSGTASGKVTSVTWSNAATGENGDATGLATWESGRIGLNAGQNVITVTATDETGRKGACILTVTRDMASVSLVLNPTNDASVFSDDPSYRENTDYMFLGYDTAEGFLKERVFLGFDVSGIPAGSTINSAMLELYCCESDPLPAPTMNVTVCRVVANWKESSISWINQPTVNFTPSTTTAVAGRGSWYYWNILEIVDGWYAENYPNYGVRLTSSAEDSPIMNWRTFYSRTGAEKPRLRLNYTPERNPPAIAITSPTSDSAYTTSLASINLGGTVVDDYALSSVAWKNQANGLTGSITANSPWTTTVPLVTGTNNIVITAIDRASNASSDAIVVVYSPPDTTAPSVPVNVVATTISPTETVVTWSASQDAGGGIVLGYRVYRNGILLDADLQSLQYSDTNFLHVNSNYCYTVAAFDSAATPNVSAQSTQACTMYSTPFFMQKPTNESRQLGETVTFVTTAGGTPPLSFQWSKNGQVLADNARISGSRSRLLTLTGVTVNDIGTYSVSVANLGGSTNASAELGLQIRDRLNEGLAAYYPFDGSATNILGTGNNGTPTGAVLATDRFNTAGAAFDLNGSAEINFETSPPISPNGSFAYSFWMISTLIGDYTSQYGHLWLVDRSSDTIPLVSLATVTESSGNATKGQFWFYPRYDDGTSTPNNSNGGGVIGGKLIPQKWQHIAMVRDYSNAFRLYVDGLLVGSALDIGKPLTPPAIVLGRNPLYGENGLVGRVDDLRVYSRALASDEVALLAGRIVVRMVGENFELSWHGGILTSADKLSGPWTPVPGATSPCKVPFTTERKFFRSLQN